MLALQSRALTTIARQSSRNMSTAPSLRLSRTRLALVQLGDNSSDKSYNLQHARDWVLKAARGDNAKGNDDSADRIADMVVLPECFNSPYGVNHFAKYAESFEGLWEKVKQSGSSTQSVVPDGRDDRWTVDGKDGKGIDVGETNSESLKMLSSVAKEAGVVLVGGSIPERDDCTGKLYNTSTVFNEQGQLISIFRKIHLFDIDIPGKMTFQESETLTGGDRPTVFDCTYGRFGLAICYDMRFPELAQIAARMGAGAIIYPGAFNTTTGPRHWELLQRSRANDNQFYVAACSPARPAEGTDAYPAWGHSTVTDPWATVVATTEEKEGIVRWTLEPDQVQEVRKFVPVGRQRRFDVYPDVSLG